MLDDLCDLWRDITIALGELDFKVVLNKFKESKAVQSVFYALRPAVTGLIAVAGFGVFKISVLTLDKFNVTHHWADFLDFKAALLFIVLYVITNKINKHPIFFIAAGALVGVIIGL